MDGLKVSTPSSYSAAEFRVFNTWSSNSPQPSQPNSLLPCQHLSVILPFSPSPLTSVPGWSYSFLFSPDPPMEENCRYSGL
ncbi:hypothetical protein TorRG33x02_128100 [Trema orientale]|uniref:Uncharacterized protein n=1 Tax=Trema orientale TaxID=63057 RepID=A0A2P5F160_TREOI|nr:hypothetical protein TorRG33x02_128100 [Trema orientale]